MELRYFREYNDFKSSCSGNFAQLMLDTIKFLLHYTSRRKNGRERKYSIEESQETAAVTV